MNIMAYNKKKVCSRSSQHFNCGTSKQPENHDIYNKKKHIYKCEWSVNEVWLPAAASESVNEVWLPAAASESVNEVWLPAAASESVNEVWLPVAASESVVNEMIHALDVNHQHQ